MTFKSQLVLSLSLQTKKEKEKSSVQESNFSPSECKEKKEVFEIYTPKVNCQWYSKFYSNKSKMKLQIVLGLEMDWKF